MVVNYFKTEKEERKNQMNSTWIQLINILLSR